MGNNEKSDESVDAVELKEVPSEPSVDDHGKKGKKSKKDKKQKDDKAVGPVTKRQCRDVFWLVLFALFWIGMFIIAGFAYQVGDPYRLIYGIDYRGNLCGRPNADVDMTDRPYLYYFDISSPFNGTAVCLQSCPNETTVFQYNPLADASKALCLYDVQPTSFLELQDNISNGTCVSIVFESSSLLKRCVPNPASTNGNLTTAAELVKQQVIGYLNARGLSLEMGRDIFNEWRLIAVGFGIAVGCALIWLVLLQLFTGFMVWTSILAVLIASLGSTAYFWFNWYTISNNLDFVGRQFDFSSLNTYVYNSTTFLVCAIITSVIALLLLLSLLFLGSRIRLAIAIVKVASRAVLKMPSLLLFPLFKALMLLGVCAFFLFVMIYLSTAGEITTISLDYINPRLSQASFTSNSLYNYLQIYVLFGFFWAWNLVIAIGDTTIAGAVATWYWTRNKKKLPWFIVARSVWRVFRYHLGSLALGSMIIALVQVLRYLLHRFEKQVNKSNNQVVAALIKCVQAVLWCFERFIKFLNRNAYVEIAVYGYSFCRAARKAFELIIRNAVRLAVISKVGDFCLWIAAISITAIAGFAGNYLIIHYAEDPTFWIYPVLVIVIMAYGVSYSFLAVMSMAVNTIFVCFCEDVERNDGSEEKPYYMVKKLRKFVDEKEKEQTDLAS